MYNYSVVIPHKNNPDLLRRCLESLPVRDDLQVIIVDDNSDGDIVDFKSFPGLNQPNTLVVFDKSGLGAGHARNVGMDLAEGKWLVFSDCDDFFEKNIFDAQMDAFKDDTCDLVFFKINYRDSETLQLADFEHKANSIFDLAKKENDNGYILYRRNAPWAKFIRRELVVANHVCFDETRWSNDAWFSTRIALLASNVKYVNSRLYNYTYRENSLIKASSLEALICRLDVALKCEGELIGKSLSKYRAKHVEYWFYLLLKKSVWIGICNCFRVLKVIGFKSFVRGFLSNLKSDVLKSKS